MAREFSFELGLVIHGHDVRDLDQILAHIVAEIEESVSNLTHDVHVWHKPDNDTYGVHSDCERGICKIEGKHDHVSPVRN